VTPPFRLSVTARLALLTIALTLASNLALIFFIWNETHSDALVALRRDTIEQADALAAVYRAGGLPALESAFADAREAGDKSLILSVLDADGNRLRGDGPRNIARTTLEPIAFRIGLVDDDEQPWSKREAGFALRSIGPYWLLDGRLLDDWQETQRTIERALFLSMLLSLILGVIGGLIVTRYVGRRMARIAQVVEDVADGDLSRRVATIPGGRDAFDRLAQRLNAMLDRLQRLMGELRVVTDSLAHDLRSPLARLRTKTETALLTADPMQRDTALSGLLVETDLVMRMLTTVIEISRSEALSRDHFAPAAPASLIEDIAELYAPVAEDVGIAFHLIIEERPPALPLHRELMSQAITNLIDNALNHAASGGEVTLRLVSRGGEVRIQVEDRGPGIPLAHREQALRRFGRLDTARSTPGAGLGLALVDAVARLHGGRLELGDNAPGLIARILIPA
jgi:signal transduction histidine kinase